jgi:hypothetical protein
VVRRLAVVNKRPQIAALPNTSGILRGSHRQYTNHFALVPVPITHPKVRQKYSQTMSGPSKTTYTGRTAHAEAILGGELCARLPQTKVLLVGAGGIGCELRESSLCIVVVIVVILFFSLVLGNLRSFGTV